MASNTSKPRSVAVIGGGPAGLMAAETVAGAGVRVDVYDGMASLGRKFLLAGKGGLNLTHSEPIELFLSRYGSRRAHLQPIIENLDGSALRDWARGLGIENFAGSSGRVFPVGGKSAPLLRAWLHRLRGSGVTFHVRHRWEGWDADGAIRLTTPQGCLRVTPDAVVLALGGGSWPQLGSDGAWVPILAERGVRIEPLRPSNCGFDCGWSDHFRFRCAGKPVKAVALSFADETGQKHERQGEFVITETGVEGGLIYAFSALLRDAIEAKGPVLVNLDLAPGRELTRLAADLSKPRGTDTLAKILKRRAGVEGVKAGLLRESVAPGNISEPSRLAAAIKTLPLRLIAPRPLEEAISSAGGIAFEALDDRLMLKALPGVFCAGEMLDWEAPTGGYLLTACFATGKAAGLGALVWLEAADKQR